MINKIISGITDLQLQTHSFLCILLMNSFQFLCLHTYMHYVSIIKVVLFSQQTEADSPWTETTKFKVNDTYFVDPDVVHPLFEVKSIELQKTIPHDHAILFTRYFVYICTLCF